MEQLLCAPVFRADAILAIAPIALVTMVEHVGDITTNSAVTGQNFMVDPGVHRTLLGDGLATALAGLHSCGSSSGRRGLCTEGLKQNNSAGFFGIFFCG